MGLRGEEGLVLEQAKVVVKGLTKEVAKKMEQIHRLQCVCTADLWHEWG